MKNTFKKTAIAGFALAAMANSAYAESESHTTELASHKGIYLEPKLIVTLGEKIAHEESTLEGDIGYGVGFDLGYSFTEYFALELDGSYARVNVEETLPTDETEADNASFYTYGVNAVLTYPLTSHFIALGKVGYGYEHEDLGSLGIKGTDHGVNWAVGAEYSFTHHLEVSFEYEAADIESARGDSLQLGLIYKL